MLRVVNTTPIQSQGNSVASSLGQKEVNPDVLKMLSQPLTKQIGPLSEVGVSRPGMPGVAGEGAVDPKAFDLELKQLLSENQKVEELGEQEIKKALSKNLIQGSGEKAILAESQKSRDLSEAIQPNQKKNIFKSPSKEIEGLLKEARSDQVIDSQVDEFNHSDVKKTQLNKRGSELENILSNKEIDSKNPKLENIFESREPINSVFSQKEVSKLRSPINLTQKEIQGDFSMEQQKAPMLRMVENNQKDLSGMNNPLEKNSEAKILKNFSKDNLKKMEGFKTYQNKIIDNDSFIARRTSPSATEIMEVKKGQNQFQQSHEILEASNHEQMGKKDSTPLMGLGALGLGKLGKSIAQDEKVHEILIKENDSSLDVSNKIINYLKQNIPVENESIQLNVVDDKLGTLFFDVKKLDKDNISLQVRSQRPEGFEFFEGHKTKIIDALQKSGIQVTEFNVTHSSSEKSWNFSSNNFFQQGNQPRGEQQSGQHQHQQDSQRRRELWREFEQREAA